MRYIYHWERQSVTALHILYIYFLVLPRIQGLNALSPGHFSGLHLQWVALEVKFCQWVMSEPVRVHYKNDVSPSSVFFLHNAVSCLCRHPSSVALHRGPASGPCIVPMGVGGLGNQYVHNYVFWLYLRILVFSVSIHDTLTGWLSLLAGWNLRLFVLLGVFILIGSSLYWVLVFIMSVPKIF